MIAQAARDGPAPYQPAYLEILIERVPGEIRARDKRPLVVGHNGLRVEPRAYWALIQRPYVRLDPFSQEIERLYRIATQSSTRIGSRFEDDAHVTPRWSAFLDDPPLAPRQAIQAAQVELNKLVSNTEGWSLKELRMIPLAVPDGWAYIVEFREPPPRADGGITGSLGIVVLMNGHAVGPTRSPRPART